MAAARAERTPAGLRRVLVATLIAFAGAPSTSFALDPAGATATSEAVLGRAIDVDPVLLDRDGHPVRLSSYRGRPLLVSFVYTGCFTTCPLTTRRLAEAVREANDAFGANAYRVVSIGFNQPDDSPAAMREFAARQRARADNWEFLSLPAASVEPLTRAFGFSYLRTPAGIDHVLQVSMLDGRGRIVRQVYGDQPPTQDVVEPLRRLLRSEPLPDRPRWQDLVDRLRLICTVYDPATGSYRVSLALPLELAGGLTFILVMTVFFVTEWRAARRARRKTAEAST